MALCEQFLGIGPRIMVCSCTAAAIVSVRLGLLRTLNTRTVSSQMIGPNDPPIACCTQTGQRPGDGYTPTSPFTAR